MDVFCRYQVQILKTNFFHFERVLLSRDAWRGATSNGGGFPRRNSEIPPDPSQFSGFGKKFFRFKNIIETNKAKYWSMIKLIVLTRLLSARRSFFRINYCSIISEPYHSLSILNLVAILWPHQPLAFIKSVFSNFSCKNAPPIAPGLLFKYL